MSVVFLWYLVTFPFVPSRPSSGAESNYLRMFNSFLPRVSGDNVSCWCTYPMNNSSRAFDNEHKDVGCEWEISHDSLLKVPP